MWRANSSAQILLAADAGAGDEDIAISVGVRGSTVCRTKRRFLVGNLEEALSEEPRPGASRKLSGKEEALLIATACSNPPDGRARTTRGANAMTFAQRSVARKNDATVISLENVAIVTPIDVALLPRAPMFDAEGGDVDLAGES